jgi:two-component system, NarL family, response regulator LiaR
MVKSAGQLTKREEEVLVVLAKGLLYKEMAVQLGVSLDTVKKHCKNIYHKLKVRNRTEATNYFNTLKAA